VEELQAVDGQVITRVRSDGGVSPGDVDQVHDHAAG
jgi:hypothetical protein